MKDEKSLRGYRRQLENEMAREEPSAEKLQTLAEAVRSGRWKPGLIKPARDLTEQFLLAAVEAERRVRSRREARGLKGGLG